MFLITIQGKLIKKINLNEATYHNPIEIKQVVIINIFDKKVAIHWFLIVENIILLIVVFLRKQHYSSKILLKNHVYKS